MKPEGSFSFAGQLTTDTHSELNLFQIIHTNFNTNFNVILKPTARSLGRYFSVPHRNPASIYLISHLCHMTHPSYPS